MIVRSRRARGEATAPGPREVLLNGRSSIVLVALAVAACAFNTVEMIPLGMLPQITAELGLSDQQGGVLVSGYAMVIALATVPLVRLTNRLSRGPLMVAMMVVLSVCTWVFVVSDSLPITFGSRFVTAAAHGLLWSMMAPFAVAHFAPRLRGRVLSVLAIGASTAAIVGVPGATFMGGTLGWWTPFVVVAVLGALVAVALWLAMSRGAEQAHPAGAVPGTRPRVAAFAATLLTVATSVAALFVTMTYLPLIRSEPEPLDTADLTLLLSVFGVAGTIGALFAGRWLDRWRGAVLAGGLAMLLLGLGSWWMWGEELGLLALGAAMVGASALVVPLVCQHLLFDNSPLSVTMALALHSLAFNVGVAAGGFVGGLVLRVADPSLLAPTSGVIALAACAPAVVALRTTQRPASAPPCGARR